MKNSFAVDVLASGSKGNSILIRAGKTALLVDAGISARRITTALKSLNFSPNDLSGVLITHEHTDHVKGLPIFSKSCPKPIFARENTWLALDFLRKIDRKSCKLLPLNEMTLGDITIKPFNVSHDASETVGYNFFYKKEKCTLATDLGEITPELKKSFYGSDVIILEANHDDKMLNEGSYPKFLKDRIKGPLGHLSNDDAASFICDVLEKKPTDIILAHLSQENNRPSIAENTILSLLKKNDLDKNVSLYIASQNNITSNQKGEC